MLFADSTRLSQTPQKIIQTEVQLLSAHYPNKKITIYACGLSLHNHANAVTYLLSFEKNRIHTEEKIAITDGRKCHYPSTSEVNFSATNSAKLIQRVYPPLEKTYLVDFFPASESAIKSATWSAITTENIFKKTIHR